MSHRTVEVTAPSRLHFGLLSFGGQTERSFGGVGVMIKSPHVQVRICHAPAFRVCGAESVRVQETARRWAKSVTDGELPRCEIQVNSVARLHAGLGLGTQLGLSVAAGLYAFAALPPPPIADLAHSIGRGKRSAIGTHGFAHGGFLVELGKRPEDNISPLERRHEFPTAWRFVLVCPRQRHGLHGGDERHAFANLPPVSQVIAGRLSEEIHDRMLPALENTDFALFSESVFQYGHLAGLCFAEFQGGPYNGSDAERLVQQLRELGVAGVGQSSWGPTIFGLCPNQTIAEHVVAELRSAQSQASADIWISPACNTGADVVLHGD